MTASKDVVDAARMGKKNRPSAEPALPNRIREHRERLDLTVEELAELAGTTAGTISKLETGRMHLSLKWMQIIATALSKADNATIAAGDLLPHSETRTLTVPLVGYVGAGDMYYPDPQAGPWVGFEEVEAPPGADGVRAVRVSGKSMEPHYRHGWLVYFKPDGNPDESIFLDDDCIVQLRDGRAYLKHVVRGSKRGRYTLESYGGDPPIRDVEIEWVARVEWVKRSRR
jgi:phage repressor protein C with HTH and peptisase S24 domain